MAIKDPSLYFEMFYNITAFELTHSRCSTTRRKGLTICDKTLSRLFSKFSQSIFSESFEWERLSAVIELTTVSTLEPFVFPFDLDKNAEIW